MNKIAVAVCLLAVACSPFAAEVSGADDNLKIRELPAGHEL